MQTESGYQARWRQAGIPESLIVKGDLDLRGAGIDLLPDNLIVMGDLIIQNTVIQQLPRRLKVGGNVDLTGSPLKALPNCMQVGADLILTGIALLALPNGIRVNGNLILTSTQLFVPEEMYLAGAVHRDNSASFDSFFYSAGYTSIASETLSNLNQTQGLKQ